MHQPVILCGLGNVGSRVLEYLQAAGLPVRVIDNRCKPHDSRLRGAQLIQGDFRQREVLEQAGLAHARAVMLLTGDDLVNISTTLMVRHLQPDVRVVVRLFNQNLLARLGKAVTNVFALSVSTLTAPLIALTALTGEALGTFSLEDGVRQVAEVTIAEGSSLLGRTVGDLAAKHNLVILGHLPARATERFLLDVDAAAPLSARDRLMVCGEPRDLIPLLAPRDDEFLPHLLWASWLRRTGRIVGRTLADIDLPVKITLGVLAAVVAASTLIYHLGMNKPLALSFFRTISVIATTADVHGEELQEDWQKFFVGFLRVFGAALMATFTAIVTNYLIRARLGKALELRRIPDGGHVVVCGVGNIGFRVVQELLRGGEKVVAIEQAADGRFLATVRRLGVPVIIGDATVLEVLKQANAATARSVVAATSDQLANLEIALVSRELNPKQRVVLRMSDPYMAETLREAANIRLALSTSALAAPAFVAALFGDRVQNIFLVAGRVLAVVELVVQADDPCLHGQVVRALTIDYKMLPVSLAAADRKPRAQMLNHRLGAGDHLGVILALPDLARLLRRERVPTDWVVDVTTFPLPARDWVVQVLRSQRGCDAETAEKALGQLPFCVGSRLTRGQAEDLLALCRRERVTAELRQEDGHASTDKPMADLRS